MAKKIVNGAEARRAMKSGIDKLANVVKATLGPQGRNVSIHKAYGAPLVTNDGVSIAKEIELSDEFENMGAQLIKEVSVKTNEIAGDGTTTATLMAQSLAEICFDLIDEGINPVKIRKEMNLFAQDVVARLDKMAIPVVDNTDIAKVGTISSASEEIGKLIASAMDVVGRDGIVTIEEGTSVTDILSVTNGMELERGYLSQYMVTNHEKDIVEYNGAYVLVTSLKIMDIMKILPVLEYAKTNNASLLIIADEVGADVVSSLAYNNVKDIVRVTAIQAPGFGENRVELLKDIATFAGATLVDENVCPTIEGIDACNLGGIATVKITKDKTTLVNGGGDAELLEKRRDAIRYSIAESKSEFEKEQLKERLASLSGGVALISVGALTETELKEKKLRIEDAVNATKAAVLEGIVSGGGTALFDIYKEMRYEECSEIKEALLESLSAPIVQIMINVGLESSEMGAMMLELLKASKGKGFDGNKEELCNMIDRGIIDPVLVTKSTILNAISVVSTIITVEACIGKEEL